MIGGWIGWAIGEAEFQEGEPSEAPTYSQVIVSIRETGEDGHYVSIRETVVYIAP